ncbi:MAG: BACON domain-containing protein [Dysgonamonadaceae bacterium]|nr:BACON domain-containing protein [Dysgonamonadaceae bacterium]MDD4728731.1 BACON domain-containing protein [Dysgonamonadaceae bacterium]
MKKNILLLIFLTIIFQSCDEEIIASLTLNQTEFTILEAGGSQFISFESNVDWTAKSSENWCIVSPSSGDASTKGTTITLTENEAFDNRACTVTITAGSLSQTIDVKQSGKTGLLLTQDKYDLSNDATTIEVEVRANVKFDVTISDEWIKKVSTEGASSKKITFSIAKNESYDNREGSITIKQTDGTLATNIKVFQSQKNAIILSTKTYNLSSLYHTLQVELKTNVDFKVIIPDDAKKWISQPDTRALRNETLTFYVSTNNTGYDDRTTEIYIKDKATELQDTLTINQEAVKEDLVEEAWFMRKTNGKAEKFFAIGGWNIPGYVNAPEKYDPTDRTDAEIFKTQTRNLNIVFTRHPLQKDFMSEDGKILMTIMPHSFTWLYMSKLSDPKLSSSIGGERGYYRNQYLKKAVDDTKFIQELDNAIKKHINSDFPNAERGYSPFDEVAQHMHIDNYHVPNVYGDKVYERLKVYDPDAIVYIDLAGNGKGATSLFERRYLKTHTSMPKDPPYDAVSESARAYALWARTQDGVDPLQVFRERYDGTPVYQYNGNVSTGTPYTTNELRSFHYENVKLFAEDYKGNGNVFGINAYRDFHADPRLVGITVDAIRAGLGDPTIPIWLYFDGNGYAKSSSMSTANYIKELECQLYTSIIHGATGIFFWNTNNGTTTVWDALQPSLEVMKTQIPIFKSKTLEKRNVDDLHIMIKQDDKGQKYILATNTSKTNAVTFSIDNVAKNSLAPLEVYVAPF